MVIFKDFIDEGRVINLEGANNAKEIFQTISSPSGTVATYTGLTISQDEAYGGKNAFAVETLAGRPTEKALFTALGDLVTIDVNGLESDGSYNLTGTPTASEYGLIWQVKGTAKAFGEANIPEEMLLDEFDYTSEFVREGTTIKPINDGDDLDMGTGGLKDKNVVTAIPLGSAIDPALLTTKQNIVGAINELINVSVAKFKHGIIIGDSQGNIAVAADFPTTVAVSLGDRYIVTATVTDNDATKTNTGQSFIAGDNIFWNNSSWSLTSILVGVNQSTNYLYDIIAFDYYINDEKYSHAEEIGLDPNLNVNEQFFFVGINPAGKVEKKNSTFNPSELQNTIELAAFASLDVTGVNPPLAVGATSAMFLDNFIKNNYIRNKIYFGTQFVEDTAKVTENAINDRQIDTGGGYLSDADQVSKFISADTNIAVLAMYHISGVLQLAPAPLNPLIVSNSLYDNGTDLATIDDNNFLSHTLARSSRTGTRYFIYSQGQYSSLKSALDADINLGLFQDELGLDVTPLAQLILKKNDTNIRIIKDLRKWGSNVIPEPKQFTDGVINLSSLSDGALIDDATVEVTESAGVVTFTITKITAGDLTVQFDETNFLISSPTNITLTAGTDISPLLNNVYFLENNGILSLNASISGFPTTGAFAPVAELVVPSATRVSTDGVYKFHFYNNHIAKVGNNGHLDHINSWIRKQAASWVSGVVPTVTITTNPAVADNIDFSNTIGEVLQLHDHGFPVFDTSISSFIYNINNFTTPYNKITDLNAINATDDGTAIINNNRYSLFIWGAVGENDADCNIFVNSPSGVYTSDQDAIDDISNYTNTTIPVSYKGVGFPIARVTLRYSAGSSGTYTLLLLENITESGSTGGGGGTGVSLFDQLIDTPITKIGQALKILQVNAGETALEFVSQISLSQINALDANGLGLYDDGGNGIFIDDGGNVGINVLDPAEKLEIDGNILFSKNSDRTIAVEDGSAVAEEGGNLTLKAGSTVDSGSNAGELILIAGNDFEAGGKRGGKLKIQCGFNGFSNAYSDVLVNENGGTFIVGGATVLTPSDTQDIAAASGVTAAMIVGPSLTRIQGSGGAVDVTANPQIAAGVDGQVIRLQGDNDTNTVKFDDGTGLSLNGGTSFTMGKGDILQLTYDTGDALWYEISRSDN